MIRRVFQRFSSDQRASMASSFRLGHRRREAVGEYYYVIDGVNIAFPTRKRATDHLNDQRKDMTP